MMEEKIKTFEQVRGKSCFCRLSIGDGDIPWNSLQKINTNYPFAFIAYLDGYLSTLDKLFIKYKIEECGHRDFKERLKDRVFNQSIREKELNQFKRLISTVLELLAADYFSELGEEILNLSAWTGRGIDVLSKLIQSESVKKYFTEVKYIGNDPERYRLSTFEGVVSGWVTSPNTIYDYINMRIADAVFQFEKQKDKTRKKERRILVYIYDHPAANITKNLFNENSDWSSSFGKLSESLKLRKEQAERYLQHKPEYYHNEVGEVRFLFIDSFLRIKKMWLQPMVHQPTRLV